MKPIDLLPKWIFPNSLPITNEMSTGTLLEQVAVIYNKVNSMIEDFNAFSQALENLTIGHASAFEKRFDQYETEMAQRFQDFIDVVDLKLKSIGNGSGTSYDDSELREMLATLESTVNSIQSNLNAVIGRVNSNTSEINKLTENYNLIVEDLANLGNELSQAQSTLVAHDQMLANHEERITALENVGGSATTVSASNTYVNLLEWMSDKDSYDMDSKEIAQGLIDLVAELEVDSGGTIFIPSGEYYFNELTDTQPNNAVKLTKVNIIGCGREATKISHALKASQNFFEIAGNVFIKDLTLYSTSEYNGSYGIAISTNDTTNNGIVIIDNVAIYNVEYAIYRSNGAVTENIHISNLFVENAGHGLSLLCNKAYSETNTNFNIHDCFFKDVHCAISGNDFKMMNIHDIKIYGYPKYSNVQQGISLVGIANLEISNVQLTGKFDEVGIYTRECINVDISNIEIVDYTLASGFTGIMVNDCEQAKITSCRIDCTGMSDNKGVQIANTQKVDISNCKFIGFSMTTSYAIWLATMIGYIKCYNNIFDGNTYRFYNLTPNPYGELDITAQQYTDGSYKSNATAEYMKFNITDFNFEQTAIPSNTDLPSGTLCRYNGSLYILNGYSWVTLNTTAIS